MSIIGFTLSLLSFFFADDPVTWRVSPEALGVDLASINGMAVTEDRHVFLLSVADGQVVELGPNGKKENAFGKRGNGPGEFSAAYRMEYLPQTQTLFIADGRKRKWMVFKRDGGFIREFPVLGIQLAATILGENLAAFTNARLSVSKPNQGVDLFLSPLQTKPTGESLLDEKFKILHFDSADHSDPQKMPGSNNFIRFPWTPRVLLAKSPDGRFLYVGSSREIRFSRIEASTGKVTGIFHAPVPRVPLEKAEVDDYLLQRKREWGGILTHRDFKNPDFKTVVRKLFCDSEGRLWFQLYGRFGDSRATWLVLNREGRAQGTISLPAAAVAGAATAEHIWYYENTQDGWSVEKATYILRP